jgi:hypothetical protein
MNLFLRANFISRQLHIPCSFMGPVNIKKHVSGSIATSSRCERGSNNCPVEMSFLSRQQPVIWEAFLGLEMQFIFPENCAFLFSSIYCLWAASAFFSYSISYLNTTAIKFSSFIRAKEIDNPLDRSFLQNSPRSRYDF